MNSDSDLLSLQKINVLVKNLFSPPFYPEEVQTQGDTLDFKYNGRNKTHSENKTQGK